MGKLKRCLAGLLAVATVLSSSNIAYAAAGLKTNADGNLVYGTTAAEAVAIQYVELTDAEKAILGNAVIAQGILPDAELPSETLITLDSEKKVIIAKEFVDADGAYKWKPVSAVTKKTDGSDEIIGNVMTFGTSEDGVYTTSNQYEATGAFSVHVTYELQYKVSIDEQTRILSIPGILADGMTYMNKVSELRGDLSLFQSEGAFTQIKDAKGQLNDVINMTDAEKDEEIENLIAEKGGYDKILSEIKQPGSEFYEEYQKAKDNASAEGSDEYNSIKEIVTGDKKEEFKAKVTVNGALYETVKDQVINGTVYNNILAEAKNPDTAIGAEIKTQVTDSENGKIYAKVLAEAKNPGTAIGAEIKTQVTDSEDGEIYDKVLNEATDSTKGIGAEIYTEITTGDMKDTIIDKIKDPKSSAYSTFKKLVKDTVKAEAGALWNEQVEQVFENNYDGKIAEYVNEYYATYVEDNFSSIVEDNFADYISDNYDTFVEDYLESYFKTYVKDNYDEFVNKYIGNYFYDYLKDNYDDILNTHYDNILENNLPIIIEATFDTIFDEYIFKDLLRDAILEEVNKKIDELKVDSADMLAAINALEADINAGGLDYFNSIKVEAGSELPFLINNWETIIEIEPLYGYFASISAFINNEEYAEYIGSGYEEAKNRLESILSKFVEIKKTYTKDAVDALTSALTTVYEKDEAFETLVQALLAEGVELKAGTITPTDWLTVYTHEAVKAVDAATISVTVSATGTSGIINDFGLKNIGTFTESFVLSEGLSEDIIKIAIDAKVKELLNGDEDTVSALGKWLEAGYNVTDPDAYQSPEFSEYPTELKADEKYEISGSYTPRCYNITSGDMEPVAAYHGTKILLPSYAGEEEKIYEYTISYKDENGKLTQDTYNEGAELIVTHDMEIKRTEKTGTLVRLLELLPVNHEFADAVKTTILPSTAVKNPEVFVTYPVTVDPVKTRTVVTDDGSYTEHYTTAKNQASGNEGIYWEPVSAELIKTSEDEDGNTIENVLTIDINSKELESTDGGKEFSWTPGDEDYDYLRVNYRLQITEVIENGEYGNLDSEKLLTYLNLSKNVVDEVKAHEDALKNKINLVNTTIKGDSNLQLVMLTATLEELQGDLTDGLGNDALNAILGKNTGDELNLYTYLKACCPPDDNPETENVDESQIFNVADYLYHDYYKKIRDEAAFLAPHLRAIGSDPMLADAFASYGYTFDESIRQDIFDFAEKLDGVKVVDGEKVPTGTGLSNTIKDLSDLFIIKKDENENNQAEFSALVNGIVNNIINAQPAVKVQTFTEADAAKGAYAQWSGTSVAPGKVTINVTATALNGDSISKAYSFGVGDDVTKFTIDSATAEAVKAIYDAVKLEAGITADNYMYYDEVGALPGENTVLDLTAGRAFYYTFTYQQKNYTEDVIEKTAEGDKVVDTVTFTGTDTNPATIVLKTLNDDPEHKYVYEITEVDATGKSVKTKVDTATTNTYIVKNLKSLALGNDTLTIERLTYNLATDKIDALVDDMNAGLKGSGASFVKVKDYTGKADNGVYKAIVLSMDANLKTEELLPAFGTAIANIALDTDYIGFGAEGDNAFMTRVGEDGTQIYMQTMIDLLLETGISLEKIAAMTDANGSILTDKHVKFNDAYVVLNSENKEVANKLVGGELVKSGIQFGADTEAIPFHITLTGQNSESLKSIKNLQNSYGNNINVATGVDGETNEGTIVVDATMPEKVYTIYMSMMLMIDAIDESELDGVDPALEEQIKDLCKALKVDILLDETNYKVIENTLNTYLFNGEGEAVDLEPYAAVIDTLIDTIDKVLNNEDGEYNGNPTIIETKSEGGQYAFKMTYDIANMLSNVEGIGDFVGFLGENTKITIPMSFTVLNISAGVEAIILDWSQSGLNKLRYVKDVAEYLNVEVSDEHQTSGPVYVYLLEDIEDYDELLIDVPTVLNLNGHGVLSDITANAALRIVDSELNANEAGFVNGIITDKGDNVRIAAGHYPLYNEENPLPVGMLREGYHMVGDEVVSQYYSITKNEEDKTIDVALSTDFAKMTEGNMQTLALDMISDIVFNLYTVGKIAVDGKELFAANTDNLMADATDLESIANELATCVRIKNMKSFAEDIYADFSDYDRIADLVEHGGEVTSFDLTTANWGAKARLLDGEEGKYIGLDLATSGEETYTVRFSFKNANPELANTLRTTKELITFNRSFSYEGIEFVDGSVNIKGSLTLDVLADLSKNIENDPQKSSDYVTAIAAVLAYSLEGEEREDIVTAIVDYENDIYAGALEGVIDNLTVEQFVNAVKAAGAWQEIGVDEEGNKIYERLPFEEIIKELGLRNLLTDTIAVEACYGTVLDIAYNLVNYVDSALSAADRVQDRVEIYGNKLGSKRIKHVAEIVDEETNKTHYVKTYGVDLVQPYGKALSLSAKMKLFSEYYVPPVDDAINELNELLKNSDSKFIKEDGKIIDVVEAYKESVIPEVAEARAAYDELSESMKKYVPAELYKALLEIEAVYNSWGVWVADLIEAGYNPNYSGKAYKPVDEVHVYDGANRLTYKQDYTLSYQYNVNAADATDAKAPRVIVKLRKNYTGTVYAYFTINQIDLAKAWVNPEASEEQQMAAQAYAESVGLKIDDVYATATSSTKTTNFKKPVVYLNGKKVSTAEYGLFYNKNSSSDKKSDAYKQAGCSYPITVYGKDKNFAAPEYKEVDGVQVPKGYVAFQHVASYMMSKVSVAKIANQPYNFGEEVKLETAVYGEGQIAADKKNNGKLVVTYGSGKNKLYLYEGVHFITDYMNNVDAGTATITLVGTGMSEKSYVESYNLEHPDAPITTPENGVEFDTRSFTGTKTIKFKIVASQKLTSSMVKLLTLQQKTNEAGEIIEELVPLKKGYIQKTYTGTEIQLNNAAYAGNAGDYNVEATVTKVDEEGNKITETVILEEGKDYVVTYKKNTNKGTATATFKGIGNYAGTVNKSFKIVAASINDLLVSDPDIVVAYQKNGVKPVSEIILKNNNTNLAMKNGKDYTLTFSNTTKVATEIDGEYVYVNPKAANTDNYIIPRQDINARLMDKETDNPVSKSELSVANKYMPKVVIKGKGNYTGTITLYYAITPADLEEVGATITASNVKYSSKANNFATSVTLKDVNGKTLKRGTDYEKVYSYSVNGENAEGNIPAGTKMIVTVTGKGNYTGSLAAEYYVYAKSLNSSKTVISWEAFDKTYDKYEKKPDITVTYKGETEPLVEGKDYEIVKANYNQNRFVGTAKVTIKGIGNYSGTKVKTFKILKFVQDRVNLADGEVELDQVIEAIYQKGGVKPVDQISGHLTYTQPSGKVAKLQYGRDYKLTWYNTSKVVNEAGKYTDSKGNVINVPVKPNTDGMTAAEVKAANKAYKNAVATANKYMPRVRITGLGNYKGYMDVYYTIARADIKTDAEATVTAKDIKYSSKNHNYRTTITVVDKNGKKLTANTDYNVVYKIKGFKTASDTEREWLPVSDYLGKAVTIGRKEGVPLVINITSNGNMKLSGLPKGTEVEMKVDVYGTKAYGIKDAEKTVIFDEYVIKR